MKISFDIYFNNPNGVDIIKIQCGSFDISEYHSAIKDNIPDVLDKTLEIYNKYKKYFPDYFEEYTVTHDNESFQVTTTYPFEEIPKKEFTFSKVFSHVIHYTLINYTDSADSKLPTIFMLGITPDKEVLVSKVPDLLCPFLNDEPSTRVLSKIQNSLAIKYNTIFGTDFYDNDFGRNYSNFDNDKQHIFIFYVLQLLKDKVLPHDHPFHLSCQEAFDVLMKKMVDFIIDENIEITERKGE